MMVFLPPKHEAQVIFFQRVINTASLLFLRKVLLALTSHILYGFHPASFFRICHSNKCIAVGHSYCGLTHSSHSEDYDFGLGKGELHS
jgi:hypothetical protein